MVTMVFVFDDMPLLEYRAKIIIIIITFNNSKHHQSSTYQCSFPIPVMIHVPILLIDFNWCVTNCSAIGHCVHFLFILLYTYMHVYVYTWIIKCHQLNNASSYIESRYSMWNNMTLWPSTVASCLEYFLWNCHQMFATRPHWLSINICAGNRLLPSDHCLN